ncbi:hypothetical protein [Alkalibacillus haloalkaliphilus]|uniref:Uncharacterized protein n=1 Tax=Alkalibacillus haloalkaliphilus TaxID=94136 RepID=A0A511W9T7_9BACI|nr:hypothetical protein [Alkalibacillus haloalkaliphilus]GEN46843.1 hypothetical protein AHA02nite_26190 [Alkalibacillus haloalkaliphilus]
MREAFTLILAGFLIVFFDIEFNGFNIIVDVVGYIIVAVGLSKLQTYSNYAKTAMFIASILAVVSIPNIFITEVEFNTAVTPTFEYYYALTLTILQFVLVIYCLFIMRQLSETFNPNHTRAINMLLGFTAALNTIVIALMSVSINIQSHTFNMMIVSFGLMALITHTVFLVYLFKFRRIEENNDDDEDHLKEHTHEQSRFS